MAKYATHFISSRNLHFTSTLWNRLLPKRWAVAREPARLADGRKRTQVQTEGTRRGCVHEPLTRGVSVRAACDTHCFGAYQVHPGSVLPFQWYFSISAPSLLKMGFHLIFFSLFFLFSFFFLIAYWTEQHHPYCIFFCGSYTQKPYYLYYVLGLDDIRCLSSMNAASHHSHQLQ